MGIEDLKRWHWILIGVAAGAILAYTRMQMSPEIQRSISPAELIWNLQRTNAKGDPYVTDLVIYPPIEGKTFVTCYCVPPGATGVVRRQAYQLIADIPFKLMGAAKPPRPDFTIGDFVDQLKASHSTITYRFAWWSLPWAIALLWGGTAVLLIGGVWPTVINLMIGAGFGRKKEKDPEYDLDRFKGGSEPAAAGAHRIAPTAADAKQLKEMEESLHRSLASGAARADQPTTVMMNPEATPVRKLDGGPVEMTEQQRREQEARDYKGEFYPVARPAGHPEETKH